MSASSNEVSCTLLNVAQTMISKLDQAELMPLILEQLATLVQFTSASIMLIEGDNLRLVARKSALGTSNAPFVVKLDSLAHIQHVIRSGQPVIIDDTRADGRWLPRASNDAIRSWLGVPLVVKDQVIGLLNVSATTVAFFTAADIDILRTFAAFAAITLENARLYALAQQARAAAEQAARAKAAFLANMSHEIRTPMNAVIGAASLLQGTAMTAEQREYVDMIHLCGDNLLGVINEILDFSKFEAGQHTLDSEPFELYECIEDAIAIVSNAALEKGVEIAYAISPHTPPTVVGDQTRLRQVLVNLLNNAVKFTEQGEVTVIVDAPAAEKTPAAEGAAAEGAAAEGAAAEGAAAEGAAAEMTEPEAPDAAAACTLRFAVQDSGIGIAPDAIPTLFAPFAQVDTTRTRKYGGTGLGLAICKRLVELMHGAIDVTSAPGSGSTFTFTAQLGVGPAAAPLATFGPHRRALVVGKENRSRACLVTHLQNLGLQVSASDALPDGNMGPHDSEQGNSEQGNAVLLVDADLPGAHAWAAGDLWTEGRRAAWPCRILLGGDAGSGSEAASQAGFQHHLAKPIKRKLLLKALAAACVNAAPVDTPVDTPAATPIATSYAPPAALNGSADHAEKSLHILVAEDNVVNQKVIAQMVKKLGHKVDLVANGRLAAEAARSTDYDVVLMDLHMPEMDGLEATRLIRQLPRHRCPRIVALTADALLETQQSCQTVGMDGCLCKPLKFEQLDRMLCKLGVGQQAGVAQPCTFDQLHGRSTCVE